MRCFSYNFRGEGELEDLLVELWVRLEELQIEVPQLEIRRSGSSKGVLLLWLNDDPRLTASSVRKEASSFRPAIIGCHEERESTVRRRHCAVKSPHRRTSDDGTSDGAGRVSTIASSRARGRATTRCRLPAAAGEARIISALGAVPFSERPKSAQNELTRP